MTDFLKIMQQAQEMQTRMQAIQDELQRKLVTGSAGGGMVVVEADGKGTVKKVKIDPTLMKPDDVEMLEDLVAVAVGDAQRKANELAQAEVQKLTGGLQLPFKLPI